jgi:hypothetical protein
MRSAATLSVVAVLTLGACGGSAETADAPDTTGPPPTETTAAPTDTTVGPTETTVGPPTTTANALPPPVDVATLTSRGGCGTVAWHALNEDQTARLMIRTSIPEAELITDAAHYEFAVTDGNDSADASAELETGTGLDACDDVMEPDYHVDETYTAVRGMVTVDLQPGTQPMRANGTVHITGLVLRGDDGAEFTLPDMTWDSEAIGLIPG